MRNSGDRLLDADETSALQTIFERNLNYSPYALIESIEFSTLSLRYSSITTTIRLRIFVQFCGSIDSNKWRIKEVNDYFRFDIPYIFYFFYFLDFSISRKRVKIRSLMTSNAKLSMFRKYFTLNISTLRY